MAGEREQMEFDVVIVGAGPSGLSAAIRLKQLAPEAAVCVVEKGSEVGAHILSGAVIEPRALDELLPDWRENEPPLTTPAQGDSFLYLTEKHSVRLPTPPQMHNHGNYVGSLGNLCRWLAAQAEALGVEIYPGFAAAEVLEEDGRVVGIATGDMGIGRDGEPTGNYQPGMELRATYTIFAEGCRGSLTKKLFARFDLQQTCDPQCYGIGIKELWEIPAANHKPGLIVHTIGWPVDSDTYGGSFLYHWGENLVSYGVVVGLDYKNTAMKSGMLAAEAVAEALAADRAPEPESYTEKLKASWVWEELSGVRNIRPGFAKWGMWGGLLNAAVDTYVFRGKAPWTLHHTHPDNESLTPAASAPKIAYPKPDGVLTFDRLSSVFISNTNHAEDQPIHLRLRNPAVAIDVNWNEYRSPEARYCPAGVYEIIGEETGTPSLQINSQNCVHCKTCDI